MKRKLNEKEIQELIKEPDYDEIEKILTISTDGRNLVTRIPKQIANHLNIKAGDKIRFHIKIEKNKKNKLEVEIIDKKKMDKTLKDLPFANEFDRNKFSIRNEIIKLYSEKDLKQMAIEWIKDALKQRMNLLKNYKFGDDEIFIKVCERIYVIKELFNLTEEDLKDG